MAYKGKVVSGTPETHSQVNNSAGFNSRAGKLGGDTQPGPGPGAPLMTSRSVDDGPTKSARYANGVYPNSLNSDTILPGSTKNGTQSTPIDSPVPNRGQRQMPDPNSHGKASAETAAEMKIGNDPRGVLGTS